MGQRNRMKKKPAIAEAVGLAVGSASAQAVGTGVRSGWITLSDRDDLIIKEIETQSDRAAALIAQAYMEERLVEAIKARLVDDHDDVINRIFKGTGPIASFSSRIDLGLVIGLYTAQVHALLRKIKEIRNDFAHLSAPVSFDTPSIAARCENLNLSGEGTYISLQLESETFEVNRASTPREAFMNAVRFILYICDRELRLLPLRKPAPPVVTIRASVRGDASGADTQTRGLGQVKG